MRSPSFLRGRNSFTNGLAKVNNELVNDKWRTSFRDELTWAKGYRLRDLVPRAATIKDKRAKAIVKYLCDKQVRYLWDDEEQPDELLVTSCGLFCGK